MIDTKNRSLRRQAVIVGIACLFLTITIVFLQLSSVLKPDFDGGILRRPGAVNGEEIDRFVKAYMRYFKIPGLSLAIVKDSKVV